jgi:aldose 1-epimerase
MIAMVSKRPFGTTSNGEDVYLYTLIAGQYRAAISTFGATLQAFHAPDANGSVNDVVLGYGSLEPYVRTTTYFGMTIGRFANRIAKGRFTIDGVDYQVETNDGGVNSLHSGRTGFSFRVWHAETFEVGGMPGLMLTLHSPDGDGGFPGAVTVATSYLLKDNGELVIDYEASTDKPTPFNMTNHSYFNLAGAAGGAVLDHEVCLACDRYLPVDAALIPTGECLPVVGTPFDFTTAKPIGRDIGTVGGKGYDHCFVLADERPILKEFARVEDPVSGRTLTVKTTKPAVQFYTGNFLDGSEDGKGGVRYGRHAGFCLETQFFPDGPNHRNFPDCILRPDQTYRHTTIYAFSTR